MQESPPLPPSEARPPPVDTRRESGLSLLPPDVHHDSSSDGAELDLSHTPSTRQASSQSVVGGASFSSSVLNLANTVMGSGLLTLPQAFASAGIISGILMAIGAAFLNVFSLHLLAAASKFPTVPSRSPIGAIAELAVPRWGGLLIDVSVASFGLGVCTGYLIVFTDSAVELTGFHGRAVWTLLAVLCVTPLTLMRSLDTLKFTSSFAIASLLGVTVFVIAFSMYPSSACGGYVDGTVTCLATASANVSQTCPGTIAYVARPAFPTVRALSKFVLAFGCQQNILPIIHEVRQPTERKVLLISASAVGLALLVYLAVATAGALTFGDAVCSNVLNTYPRTPVVAVVRCLIALVVLTSYPLLAFEARRSLLARLSPWLDSRVNASPWRWRHSRGVQAFIMPAQVGSLLGGSWLALFGGRRSGGGTIRGKGSDGGGGSGAACAVAACSGGGIDGGGAAMSTTCRDDVVGTPSDSLRSPPPSARIRRGGRLDSGSFGGTAGSRATSSLFVSSREQLSVSALFIAITLSVALSVKDLGVVLGLVGASAGVVISFVIPGLCYVALAPQWDRARVGALATLLLALILLPVAVTLQFVD